MRNRAAITLNQIADVRDTHEKIRRIVRVNGERGIRVGIRKQAEANTVEVSSAILAEIDAVNRAFPQVRIVPIINQYWNLVLAKKEIRIFEQSLAIPKQQLDEVEQQIMVGVQQFPDKLII